PEPPRAAARSARRTGGRASGTRPLAAGRRGARPAPHAGPPDADPQPYFGRRGYAARAGAHRAEPAPRRRFLPGGESRPRLGRDCRSRGGGGSYQAGRGSLAKVEHLPESQVCGSRYPDGPPGARAPRGAFFRRHRGRAQSRSASPRRDDGSRESAGRAHERRLAHSANSRALDLAESLEVAAMIGGFAVSKRPLVYPALLAVCLFGACGSEKTTQSANAVEPREVEVYTVSANPAPSGAAPAVVPSTLTVEHEADLLAEEQGRLISVPADEGRRVRKGQVLAQLDDSDVRKQFEQDRAEMQSAEVNGRQAAILRQSAEVELGRQSDLRKEGLGTQRDYDRARFNLEAMRQEIEKARFDLEKARAKVARDELRLSRMQIKAPFDGIVSRRYARVGETLLKDQKVLRLTELRPLLVRF